MHKLAIKNLEEMHKSAIKNLEEMQCEYAMY